MAFHEGLTAVRPFTVDNVEGADGAVTLVGNGNPRITIKGPGKPLLGDMTIERLATVQYGPGLIVSSPSQVVCPADSGKIFDGNYVASCQILHSFLFDLIQLTDYEFRRQRCYQPSSDESHHQKS